MTPQELLEGALKGALILNPITGPAALPYVIQEEMRRRTAAQAAKKPEEPKAPKAPEAPQAQSGPGGYADPGTDYSPEQLPLPTGAVDVNEFLPFLIATRAIQKEAEASREFYPKRTQVDLEAWRAREEISRQNALERMREKTKRDKELKVIDSWTAVTQADIQRETALGLGMMNLSATLGMPNPNVLNASANALAAGAQGFSGGAKPVF